MFQLHWKKSMSQLTHKAKKCVTSRTNSSESEWFCPWGDTWANWLTDCFFFSLYRKNLSQLRHHIVPMYISLVLISSCSNIGLKKKKGKKRVPNKQIYLGQSVALREVRTEMSFNMASTLCQRSSKNPVLVKKLKISCIFDHTILVKQHKHMVKAFIKKCM